MNILFLARHPIEAPSTRFRVFQYFPFFEREGISCRLITFFDHKDYCTLYLDRNPFNKIRSILRAYRRGRTSLNSLEHFNIIFISREFLPLNQRPLLRALNRAGVPVVYDFDDAVFLSSRQGVCNILINTRSVTDLIRSCAHVIAGNEYLQRYALKHNPHSSFIPTSIDTDLYRPRPADRSSQVLTLGWIGSHTTAPYLFSLKSILEQTAEKYPVNLMIVGAGREWNPAGIRTINIEWRLEDDPRYFNQIDIGLYPLPENSWTLGKCGFKGIQYMSSGVPCIASSVGANKNIITDGSDGFLCGGDKEWIYKLSLLIENPDLRKRLAVRARQTVKERFSLQANLSKYIAIFHEVHDQ